MLEEEKRSPEKNASNADKILSKEEQDTILIEKGAQTLFVSLLIIFCFSFLFFPPIRNTLSFLVGCLISLFKSYPTLLSFLLEFLTFFFEVFFLIENFTARFIYSLIISFLVEYIIYKIKINYIIDYYIFKFIFVIIDKISFVFVLVAGLFISLSISLGGKFFYISFAKNKIYKKIYTFEDAEYLKDFLNRNIPIFILFCKKEDSDKKFYLEELKKISKKYGGKYHFALLDTNEHIEKVIYYKVFKSEIVDFPKFVVLEKDKTEIFDEKDKIELIKQIEKKMISFDLNEFESKISREKEKQMEKEQKEKEDKEKEAQNKKVEEDIE